MSDSQQSVSEKLPQSNFWREQLTTVTTFSKALAAVLFVTLPCVGFYLGYQYGGGTSTQNPITQSTYLDSFECEPGRAISTNEGDVMTVVGYAGEFCHATIVLEAQERDCYLGTVKKNGQWLTIAYSKDDLPCR